MSKPKENTALATQPQAGYLQHADMDFGNDILAEMNGLDLTFEKIKNPIGGGVMFEVPGEDGEPEPVKEISGVILYHHPVYMRYDQKYTGGNNPPDCGSFDGKTGRGNPGGDCKTCRFNQFGTGEDGISKACKNRQQLFILREGELFPMILSLPSASLKNFSRFIAANLSKNQKKYSQYVTRFSLKKATSGGGIVYSQVHFKVDRFLTAEELPAVATIAEQIKVYSQNMDFDTHADMLGVDADTGEIIEPLGK